MIKEEHSEFAPLQKHEAKELELIINKAARHQEAVIFDPEQGIRGSRPVDLISPNGKTNGLVRFDRHY